MVARIQTRRSYACPFVQAPKRGSFAASARGPIRCPSSRSWEPKRARAGAFRCGSFAAVPRSQRNAVSSRALPDAAGLYRWVPSMLLVRVLDPRPRYACKEALQAAMVNIVAIQKCEILIIVECGHRSFEGDEVGKLLFIAAFSETSPAFRVAVCPSKIVLCHRSCPKGMSSTKHQGSGLFWCWSFGERPSTFGSVEIFGSLRK